MKTIIVTVDDETHRKAQIKAADRDTSVSALKGFLIDLAGSESDADRLKRDERVVRECISSFRAADRLRREDVNRRGR